MIFSWAFIGIIVGFILGIAGAGGAIVAVPLFVYFAQASLNEATALSLIAVMFGSGLNWILQRKNTEFSFAILLFCFSTLGSLGSIQLKTLAPDWIILALFIGVGLVGLISLWVPVVSMNQAPEVNNNLGGRILKLSLGGVILGVLVTMTGLGGGVMLMPFLRFFCGLNLSRGAATSLLTIFLSSVFSFLIQKARVEHHLEFDLVMALMGGSLISALFTKELTRQMNPKHLDSLRKFLVSLVILFSVGSLLLKI